MHVSLFKEKPSVLSQKCQAAHFLVGIFDEVLKYVKISNIHISI